ncbi:MAG: TIGR03557 family F420-dependent LLM class oxidoreductase [Nitrososphaerales archaeon]
MVSFAYVAATEEFSPKDLLDFALEAESYGWDEVWASDHFHPWSPRLGHSPQAWVFLGIIGSKTNRLILGTSVTAPIFRYHPAIIAQSFATLGYLFPGRIFLGLGTGEALNEIPCGYQWPSFKERFERFEEAVKIIKLLWEKEHVSFKGKHYTLKNAKIFDKPSKPIPLIIASTSPKVSELAGKYADGLMTLQVSEERYKNVIFPSFEKGAKESNRDISKLDKLILLHAGYDSDFKRAFEALKPWKPILLPFLFNYPIYDPREIGSYEEMVSDEFLMKNFTIFTKEDEIINYFERFIKLGFNRIGVSVSGDVKGFLKLCGEKVLPYLRQNSK